MNARIDVESGEPRLMTTGQVARKFKISLQTLHFYDDEGLVRPARCNGRRSYDDTSVNRLAFILEQRRLGRSLAEIAVLLANAQLLITFGSALASMPALMTGA